MSKRKLVALIFCTALCSGAVLADTLALNPDHPQTYTVVRGDTLWDISARFLREPWRWPEIWEDNPQVKNPHLIFPGDELVLVYRAGEPRLQVRRAGGRPTVKLSPEVREVALSDLAVPTVPIDAIQQFLSRPRVVGARELEAAPYVLSLEKERLIGGAGHKVYVRGLGAESATRFTVYRQGAPYRNPDDPEEVLGYEAIHIGDAVLERRGDPATMVLSRTNREVLKGDRLLAASEETIDSSFFPRGPEGEVAGKIISVVDGVTQIGQHQVVVLNLGTRDGINSGHVMAVYQAGEVIQDTLATLPEKPNEAFIEMDPEHQGGIDGFSVAADRLVREIQDTVVTQFKRFAQPSRKDYQSVQLPEERAGLVMVFRPYERISYALVVDATRPMHILDSVRNP